MSMPTYFDRFNYSEDTAGWGILYVLYRILYKFCFFYISKYSAGPAAGDGRFGRSFDLVEKED